MLFSDRSGRNVPSPDMLTKSYEGAIEVGNRYGCAISESKAALVGPERVLCCELDKQIRG